jgi:hypothetical protein
MTLLASELVKVKLVRSLSKVCEDFTKLFNSLAL